MLDPAQLVRIEAVHRGFLFQHLYTVQCLLSAAALSMERIWVESDEDVEVRLPDHRIYVQVKHRKASLAWNDIEGALNRFHDLRASHERGERDGKPAFLIISSAAPTATLAAKLAAADWPDDVRIDWPASDREARILPAPQSSLLEAAEAACEMAERVPFATLAPETLVWKLAGLVSLAATGDAGSLDHVFRVDELPGLFEQLVVQLQDLPLPPSPYRVQRHEPELSTGERVRLIVGYSGSGKTSWLAQSARHAPGALVYLDVADTPGAALANTIAREVAGRLYGTGRGLGEILLPGASGREILQLLSRRVAERGEAVTVALDNVHRLPADDLIGAVRSGRDVRFVLLARPEGEITTIEATLGITREALLGWTPDTVAAIAHAQGCRGDAADCGRLIELTGGLPLFVLNAISVAGCDYDGSVKRLCAELSQSAHSREIAQDLVLGRVFDRLPEAVADVAELLSLCDTPLTRDEVRSFGVAAGGPDRPIFDSALRRLTSQGLLQVFAEDRIKLHDAARTVGKGRLLLHGPEIVRARQEALRVVVQASLMESWHPAKLSLFLRLTGDVGRFDVLVELATEELFHEMGVWPEVEPYLEDAARDEAVPPEQRIKALDALAFADLKSGSGRAAARLDRMDALVVAHDLGVEEQLRVGMKRMNLRAGEGDRGGTMRLVADLAPVVRDISRTHERVFEYNVACAELILGDAAAAEERVQPLIAEYYELIGLTPEMVMGNNAPDLEPMLRKGTDVDDVKHLADSLDVLAKARDAQGLPAPFVRIHALKFYDLARAPDSLFRVGQDLVDQFVRMSDFHGALGILETIILPQLQQWKLADYLISVRSQYAVVLAYCARHSAAAAELERLEPYRAGLPLEAQREFESQRELIEELREFGPPPERPPRRDLVESRASHRRNALSTSYSLPLTAREKIGRNERCPCGSGKKYKLCHGRRG